MIVLILTAFSAIAAFLIFQIRGSTLMKTVISLCLFATASITYFSIDDLRGWPTEQPLPERGSVIGIDYYEPDDTREGAVFLWVKVDPEDVRFSFFPPADFRYPRAYKIPYTEGNARTAAGMKKALMDGLQVELEASGAGEGAPAEGEGEKVPGDGEGSGFYLEGTTAGARVTNPAVTNPK